MLENDCHLENEYKWTTDTAANDMTRMGQVSAECFELLKQYNSDAILS